MNQRKYFSGFGHNVIKRLIILQLINIQQKDQDDVGIESYKHHSVITYLKMHSC